MEGRYCPVNMKIMHHFSFHIYLSWSPWSGLPSNLQSEPELCSRDSLAVSLYAGLVLLQRLRCADAEGFLIDKVKVSILLN